MRLSHLAYREVSKGDCVRTDMLQEFIVWAESKTIEAAAKEMHISQSTLSKHLIALEAELGISPINRHDKGRLTPAGVRFYNGIVDVMERLNKTVEESRQIAEKTDYEIIVWDPFIFSGAMRELERIMHAFSKECSVPFHFTLRNEAYKTPGESLSEGLVDVAIGYHPVGLEGEAPQGTTEFSLMEEPLVLWCKKEHPLARKEQLLPEDLKGVPIMCSMELAHPLAPAITKMCAQRGFKPRFYRFNPTSQASFFFDAPAECVYVFTPELRNDERIRLRDDMVLRHFDDKTFAVRCCVAARNVETNEALSQFRAFLADDDNR